jgi:kanamycin kinase
MSSTPSGCPEEPVVVPGVVTRLAAGADVRPVWHNELDGLTFELGTGPGRRFVKWQPPGAGPALAEEVDRLRWAGRYARVPEVLDHGVDDGGGEWLLTAGLPGESAVAARWLERPEAAVVAIGEGLRALHDALPVAECPFIWRTEDGDPGPEVDPAQRVVCHGDACAPNTLLDRSGRWTGHVDLGALGVGDRWADLAIATWSTVWNYGPGWEGRLLEAYGIEPDPERIRLYRDLWGSGPSDFEQKFD